MDTRSLASYIDSVAFSEFLDELSKEQVGDLPSPVNRFTSNRGAADIYLYNHAQAVVLETFLAMADLFEAIPSLVKLKPHWKLEVQPDNFVIVDFLLTMTLKTKIGSFKVTAGNSDFNQIKQHLGSCLPDRAQDAFDRTISCGEGVLPEHWNFVVLSEIFNPAKAFTSKEDVIARMNYDLSDLLPKVKKWALEQQAKDKLIDNSASETRKPKM